MSRLGLAVAIVRCATVFAMAPRMCGATAVISTIVGITLCITMATGGAATMGVLESTNLEADPMIREPCWKRWTSPPT